MSLRRLPSLPGLAGLLGLLGASVAACSGDDPASTMDPTSASGTTMTATSAATVGGTTSGPGTATSASAGTSTGTSTSGNAATVGNATSGATTQGSTGAGTTGGTGGATATTTESTATGTGGGASATEGSSATSGGGTGNTPTGGASAAAVCTPGASYGDPLAGMGSVQQIAAPQSEYFAFIEGPVWVGSLGTLFFSDNASSPTERIWKLVPPATTPEVFMDASGSNGLAIDSDDQLILADQRGKQITRVDSMTAALEDTLAGPGSYKPNDVIVRSDGNIYFTDPDSGFYQVSASGEVGAAHTDVGRPNGVVLSPDENTLYVGDVGNRQIHAFPVAEDGSVASGSIFVTAENQTVDGMAVDCAGNLYAGTANGVEVFSPSAEPLGIIPTGESSNATFGGSDRKTLYVTSRSVLKYVTLAVPGLPD